MLNKFNKLKFILHLDRRRSDDGEATIIIVLGVVLEGSLLCTIGYRTSSSWFYLVRPGKIKNERVSPIFKRHRNTDWTSLSPLNRRSLRPARSDSDGNIQRPQTAHILMGSRPFLEN